MGALSYDFPVKTPCFTDPLGGLELPRGFVLSAQRNIAESWAHAGLGLPNLFYPSKSHMAGGSVRAQMVRSRQVLGIFIGKTRAGRNQWLSCSPGLLLMSFSVLCVGQEVLLQPRVFNSPFQRAGVINCTLCPCNKVIYLYLHLSTPLLGIAKNFSARSLALSQPEISLITELKSSYSASN